MARSTVKRVWSKAIHPSPKLFSFCFSIIAILTLSHCGSKQKASEKLQASLKHDLDAPVRSPDAWHWVDVNQEDFLNKVLKLSGEVFTPVGEEASALTSRAQYWVNHLDGLLRKKFPDMLQFVPKPQVIVVKESSPNAFVTSAFTCYKFPLHLYDSSDEGDSHSENADSDAHRSAKAVYLSLKEDGELKLWPKQLPCVAGNVEDLKAEIEDFNKHDVTCKITIKDGMLYPNAGCAVGHELKEKEVESVVLLRTANWVTIHSGLFTAMPNERDFVGVISHELAHYYRSHGTSFKNDYNFFYSVPEINPPQRPSADASFDILGKQAVESSTFLQNALVTLPYQTLSSELYLALGSLAKQQCSEGNCATECLKIVADESDKEFFANLGLFPFSKPKENSSYYNFEPQAKACAASLNVSYTKVLDLLSFPTWIPFREKLNANTLKRFYGKLAKIRSRLDSFTPKTSNLLETILQIDQYFKHQHDAALVDMKSALKAHLVQYTVEQEADEESVEWLNMLGFDPSAGVETFMVLSKLKPEDSFDGYIYGGNTCDQLYKNHWMGSDQLPVFIPLGNYAEVHHSACFRAFNADREILAHNYPRTSQEPVLSAPTWQDLQSIASKSHALNLNGPKTLASGPHKFKNNYIKQELENAWKGCPFYPHS